MRPRRHACGGGRASCAAACRYLQVRTYTWLRRERCCTVPQVPEKVSRIGFVAGTISALNINSFERLLFRATRGNMFLRQVRACVCAPLWGTLLSTHVICLYVSYACRS